MTTPCGSVVVGAAVAIWYACMLPAETTSSESEPLAPDISFPRLTPVSLASRHHLAPAQDEETRNRPSRRDFTSREVKSFIAFLHKGVADATTTNRQSPAERTPAFLASPDTAEEALWCESKHTKHCRCSPQSIVDLKR